jgi:acetyltransferase
MTVRNLAALFQPKSVALIGASARPGAVGNVTLRNLLAAGLKGPVWPVNPKHERVEGVAAFADVAALPATSR